ncbi:MAG: hypothetical protein VW257_12475, partial [Quisquiliibacterium sp.]
WRVDSGGERAHFLFLGRPALATRYPGVDLSLLAENGAAALVLQVADVDQAARTLGAMATRDQAGRLAVAPANASGLLLVLEQA